MDCDLVTWLRLCYRCLICSYRLRTSNTFSRKKITFWDDSSLKCCSIGIKCVRFFFCYHYWTVSILKWKTRLILLYNETQMKCFFADKRNSGNRNSGFVLSIARHFDVSAWCISISSRWISIGNHTIDMIPSLCTYFSDGKFG